MPDPTQIRAGISRLEDKLYLGRGQLRTSISRSPPSYVGHVISPSQDSWAREAGLSAVCVAVNIREYQEVLLLDQNVEINMNKEQIHYGCKIFHFVSKLKFLAEMENFGIVIIIYCIKIH